MYAFSPGDAAVPLLMYMYKCTNLKGVLEKTHICVFHPYLFSVCLRVLLTGSDVSLLDVSALLYFLPCFLIVPVARIFSCDTLLPIQCQHRVRSAIFPKTFNIFVCEDVKLTEWSKSADSFAKVSQ